MSLIHWGWDKYFASQYALCAHSGQPARVISQGRGFCRAVAENGEVVLQCDAGVVTGDWVVYDPAALRVAAILPRRSRISRKKAGREFSEQVLAANVDVVFVVAGLDGDFNLRRLERYLILARAGDAAPVVVLNKCDLRDDALACARAVDAITSGAAPVVLVSALDRGSVMQLHRYVEPGRTAVLVGSSGTGKSTITNALLGTAVQAISEVRAGDSRGRHTTTERRLFRLEEGWLLIDTPGLREIEPWTSPEAASGIFRDIEELAAGCRFRDCLHSGEPGCAVTAAADPQRLASYRKLQAELRHAERMADARAMQEEKRRAKVIERAMRRMLY
jgi:ribosome biogenesis GTPase / thiamine phosphate phosphatase